MALGVRPNPHDGRIGGRPARVWWDGDAERLRLAWRGREFDLREQVVRHRDERGTIRFSVGGAEATYRRPGPNAEDLAWDAIDVTADEPWTWEDGDFGLYVFHLATRTGPLKYRHAFDFPPARPADAAAAAHRGLVADDAGLVRRLPGMREEAVRWDRLIEVRAKFELAGIWAGALLTLEDGHGLAVVPVGYSGDVAWVREHLLPRLRRLEGWEDGPLEVALELATRDAVGPHREEPPRDWAERGIWVRAGG